MFNRPTAAADHHGERRNLVSRISSAIVSHRRAALADDEHFVVALAASLQLIRDFTTDRGMTPAAAATRLQHAHQQANR